MVIMLRTAQKDQARTLLPAFQAFLEVAFDNKAPFARAAMAHAVRQEVTNKPEQQVCAVCEP